MVNLVEFGTELISRSEAKRVAARLDAFDEVELDFRGVQYVGQGFVDDLLRGWAGQHPQVTLSPVNMYDEVRFMVERGPP
jgi:hypothetical protein